MHVALVTEHNPQNQDPIGSIAFHLAEHLETHGHQVLLLTPKGLPFLLGRTKVIGIENSWDDAQNKNSLVQILRDFQPDLLHILQPRDFGFKALHFAQDTGTPVISSFHKESSDLANVWGFQTNDGLMWSFFQGLHDVSDQILVPSYVSKMALTDIGFDRVQTWNHGVDCDLFSPRRRSDAWRRHLTNGEPNKALLLYAGNLSSEKRVELLLPIIKANPESRLAIVGDGTERRRLRDYFDDTPTIFTGELSQGDLAEAYASADIFIHPPSIQISPVVTLEAMASGLPVLAPHSGAIVDFAVHGENALLFRPGDTQQAANYVKELIANLGLRTDLSRIARQTALGRSWHAVCDNLMAIYSKLIEEKSPELFLTATNLQALNVPQL
jgi:glycosyltransferase involved in cell wall biosynthesis